ncbi:MAG TPA: hypothetical protein VJQ82_10075 [Terriglobales bacterium]|nr:hypothetical protein [Terriglobales bacterium]
MDQFYGDGEGPLQPANYELGPLSKDEEFILCRGRQLNLSDPGSFFFLVLVLTRSALETLKKIEHVPSFRGALDADSAVCPLSLSRHNHQPMLVPEDKDGQLLDRLIQRPMEVKQLSRLAIGLAVALRQLHKRR